MGLTKVFVVVVCILDFAIDVWGLTTGSFFLGIGRIGYNHDVIDFHPTSLKMFKLPMSLR